VRYLDALAAFRFGRDRARMNTQAFRNEKKMRLPLRESRLRLTEAQLSQQAHTFQNGPTQGLRSSASMGRSALRSRSAAPRRCDQQRFTDHSDGIEQTPKLETANGIGLRATPLPPFSLCFDKDDSGPVSAHSRASVRRTTLSRRALMALRATCAAEGNRTEVVLKISLDSLQKSASLHASLGFQTSWGSITHVPSKTTLQRRQRYTRVGAPVLTP
jgi:hypothetical protein